MSSTASQTVQGDRRGLVCWQVLLFITALMLLRLTGIFNIYFWEEDEISIAAGVAALVRDNVGDLYRYTPQLGYYRLLEFINLVTGGKVALIPLQMKVLSALMGVLVPVLGLFVFRDELSIRTRWLVALVLVANPILWKSSQYGNSGLVSMGLASLAIVLLTNKPGRWLDVTALGLLCVAIIVRADAILLVPLVAWLVWRNHGMVRAVLVRGAVAAAVLAAVYALIYTLDPRLDAAVSGVATHFSASRASKFWEYMVWAISPVPLLLAVVGFRKLLDIKPSLLLILLLWLAGPLGFYFVSMTTPRYYLLAIMPFAIAVAIGIDDLARRLAEIIRPSAAWIAVLLATFAHLVFGMGHIQSGWLASTLFAPGFRTDDGRMPTGALVYDSHLRGGVLAQSFRNEGFGKVRYPYWEGVAIESVLVRLGEDRRAGQTVLLLLDSGFSHAIHFHAQAAGAEYLSRAPSLPWSPFMSETWLQTGGARVMTIRRDSEEHAALEGYPVRAGDEVWIIGDSGTLNDAERGKLPAGLSLTAITSFDEKVFLYRVTERRDGLDG